MKYLTLMAVTLVVLSVQPTHRRPSSDLSRSRLSMLQSVHCASPEKNPEIYQCECCNKYVTLANLMMAPCGHNFCSPCYTEMMPERCAVCNKLLNPRAITGIDSILDSDAETSSAEEPE